MEKVLFPDKGSKVENGRVYQDLAFGSTRPRNMMPGHLCTNVDPSQTKRLAARTRRMRKIANLRRDADKKGNDVYKLMGSLKSGRIDYLAGVQLHKFHAAIKHLEHADEGLRASDKRGALRDYGLLDQDLWKLNELRGWFNKNSPAPPRGKGMAAGEGVGIGTGKYDGFGGGHTLRRSTPASQRGFKGAAGKSLAATVSGSRKKVERKSPRIQAPAGQVAGVPAPYKSHWNDFEGMLNEQKQQANTLRKSGKLVTELPRPWKDRPIEDEGFIPPQHAYASETKAHFSMSGLDEQRAMVANRVRRMQGGHKNILHHAS